MDCKVVQLTPSLFDLNMAGTVLKLNYLGEAGNDGKPTTTAATSSANKTYVKGDKVEILWKSTWYKGSILEVKEDEYKVHYDGWASSYDEWVTSDKLKMM